MEAEVGHMCTCVGGISLSEILKSCILQLPGRTLILHVAQKYTYLFLSVSQTHTHTERKKKRQLAWGVPGHWKNVQNKYLMQ